tara:strand:+ start:2327 stop:3331 length:1005 start_codon:yes stop_codon:yes gene_type:complete
LEVQITTKKDTFTVDYPEAAEYALKQAHHFWPHDEVKVHKDKQDILVNMTESERHGVITTLKLFTLYEQIIGDEFWLNFVFNNFPRPADIQPMAAMFSAIELQVHAKFYAKINEELGLANDDFYLEYLQDPELRQRIEYLETALDGYDKLRALGSFVFGEGAVLYSSFAYLKHFQSKGKNKLLNVVSGINFSARDENLHAEAAAWLFRQYKSELLEAGLVDDKYIGDLNSYLAECAGEVFEHEKIIIRKIFEKGDIEGITATQLENFAKSRINMCLKNLEVDPVFEVTYNPIADWFYDGINSYMMGDFFSAQNNQYSRGWNKTGFTWEVEDGGE